MQSRAEGETNYSVILEGYNRIEAVFEAITRDHPFAFKDDWHSDSTIDPKDPILWHKKGSLRVVARHGDTIYRLERTSSGAVSVAVRARSEEAARATMRDLKVMMPPIEPEKDAVKFEFVRMQSRGFIERQERSLIVPRFSEIRENYAPSTRHALERLLDTQIHDGLSGRILLWHGPPGTGKTYMLRALAREWKKRVRVAYVIDPENFFDSTMDYIMTVALDDDDEESETERPWTLIVLEDTGEFFSAEYTTRLEQGVARLLNFSDGILGQGLRCLFLLTTNEPIYHIHPALTRPGRCLANIHFAPMDSREAKRWFSLHGVKKGPRGQRVLAELYSIADDQGPINGPRLPVGGVEVH